MGPLLRSTCAVLALLAVAPAIAGELPVTTRVLPNGCTLAVVENHQAPVVSLRIYIRNTGSLYEGDALGSGISHYVEQVVHGGTTEDRTEEETARLLQSIGASTNAYTRRELSCFYGETHVDYLDTMLDLLSDWVQRCSLDPREIQRERDIVKQEMIKDRDEPNRVAHQLLTETMFRVHPVRHPIGGYLDNFLRITPDDLRLFFRQRYAPNNAVVVVSGDVDPAKVLDKLEAAFVYWERRPDVHRHTDLPDEPRQMGRRFAEVDMDVREAVAAIGFHTIELSHPDLYALDLLAAVLGQGRTSRLHRRVVDRDRLTDGIRVSSYTPHYGAGVFSVLTQCPYENVPAIERALFEEIARLATEPPTAEELSRAKTLIERNFVMNRLRAADQAEQVAIDMIGTGNPNFSAGYVDRIRAVSGSEVKAMARKYFARQNETLVVVKPRGEPSVFASADAAKVAPGKSEATRKIALDNGLVIVLQRNSASPTVGIEAFFRAGVLWETDENAGISNLMSRLMLRGTQTRSPAQIAEELEGAGALMNAISGNNTFGMSMAVPARELEQGLWLFAEILRDANFPEEEVEREKAISKMFIRREGGNWQSEAVRNFREAMYTTHPYRRHRFGTLESVDRIDRSAIADFHERYCGPQNGVLAVFGDLDLDHTERVLRAAFGDWKRTEDVARTVPVEPPLEESRVRAFPSGKGQVVIVLGYPGATLDSRDRWVLQVIDAAISGLNLPSGRLQEALRGKRNLIYFVHALNWNGFGAGAFYVICPCAPHLYDEVIGIIREEIARVAEEGLTPEELENAKRTCITVDHLSRQTNNERAMAAALDELYGFGWNAWQKSAETIRSITNEEVMRVARKHFAHSVLTLTAPERWLHTKGLVK